MATVNPIEMQKSLKGMDYPANKEDLVRHAAEQGTDDQVRKVLDRLPDGRYETPAEVSQAVSKLD